MRRKLLQGRVSRARLDIIQGSEKGPYFALLAPPESTPRRSRSAALNARLESTARMETARASNVRKASSVRLMGVLHAPHARVGQHKQTDHKRTVKSVRLARPSLQVDKRADLVRSWEGS